jgi:hypothetical protein
MIRLRVERSPLRQLLFGLAGVLLLLAAVDIAWVHKVSSPPETDADGVLTSSGTAEHRVDLIWGSLFMVAGGVVTLVAFGGLVNRRPVAEVTDEELRLRVAGPVRSIAIPWNEIRSIRSGSDGDDGRIPARVLLVDVADPMRYPASLWGAEWRDSILVVDTDSWEVPAEQVALHANLALEAHRRWGVAIGEV